MAGMVNRKMTKRAGMTREMLMEWDSVEPEGKLGAALCTDDVVPGQDVAADEDEDAEDTAAGAALPEIYGNNGTPPVPEKVKLQQREITALGATVNGDDGRVGVGRRVLAQLMMISLYVVAMGAISQKGGEKLQGSWVFALMFRREAFAFSTSCIAMSVR